MILIVNRPGFGVSAGSQDERRRQRQGRGRGTANVEMGVTKPQAGDPRPPQRPVSPTSSTATVSAEPAPSAAGSGTLRERAGGRETRSEAASPKGPVSVMPSDEPAAHGGGSGTRPTQSGEGAKAPCLPGVGLWWEHMYLPCHTCNVNIQ